MNILPVLYIMGTWEERFISRKHELGHFLEHLPGVSETFEAKRKVVKNILGLQCSNSVASTSPRLYRSYEDYHCLTIDGATVFTHRE
jgi:hypothetical protein